MALGWYNLVEGLAYVEPVFWFIHGLAFFVLSFTLLLLPQRVVRLEIAHRFPLLSLFGFCEAMIAWESALAPALGVDHLMPTIARTILMGIGYASLLAFGLLAPTNPRFGLRTHARLAILFPALWLAGLLVLRILGSEHIAVIGALVARYGFAVPGGILSAFSMRTEAHLSMDPRMYVLARGSVRTAEVSLAAFGILASLQPIADRLQFPLSILYTACGIGVAWGLLQTMTVLQKEIERWIEGVERSQALAADRERISRDLHDGIIQAIYAAGLTLEGVMQTIPEDPASAQDQLGRAMHALNQSIQDVRRYIFDLRGSSPESDLQTGLQELMRDFRVNTLLDIDLKVQGEQMRTLSSERRGHIFQIFREALSNVARHAQARKVDVNLVHGPDSLQLSIADDGIGMSGTPAPGGHGLRNMRERTRLLEGTLDIDSAPKKGVTVTLSVPY